MITVDRTVFLVDGQSEIRAIRDRVRKECGAVPGVRKVDCNGRNVCPQGYARRAAEIVRLCLRDRFNTVVCVVDREGRKVSAERLAEKIRESLLEEVAELRDDALYVCVPDIMFENWIIADVEGIRDSGLVSSEASQHSFDGEHGARMLTSFLTVTYRKTTHAPMLFGLVRRDVARMNSPSFQRFCGAVFG